MYSSSIVLLVAIILVVGQRAVDAQTVKQCLCSDIAPCTNKYMNTWKTCMNQCKSHLSAVSGDVNKLAGCLDSNQAILQSSIRCTQAQGDESCAKSAGAVKQVPKRYPETLEIATMSEINRMINNMGVEGEMKELVSAGRKMFGCTRKCMSSKAGNCEKTLKCGLEYPPDNVAVQKVKQCAINSGLNTANAKALCLCASKAGVKNLTPAVCAKVKIT
uniref:Uncharacterized protein n=1 Tax=Globodera rostochiensis TaxID=31243 RepID=A0A914HHY3_GLORO